MLDLVCLKSFAFLDSVCSEGGELSEKVKSLAGKYLKSGGAAEARVNKILYSRPFRNLGPLIALKPLPPTPTEQPQLNADAPGQTAQFTLYRNFLTKALGGGALSGDPRRLMAAYSPPGVDHIPLYELLRVQKLALDYSRRGGSIDPLLFFRLLRASEAPRPVSGSSGGKIAARAAEARLASAASASILVEMFGLDDSFPRQETSRSDFVGRAVRQICDETAGFAGPNPQRPGAALSTLRALTRLAEQVDENSDFHIKLAERLRENFRLGALAAEAVKRPETRQVFEEMVRLRARVAQVGGQHVESSAFFEEFFEAMAILAGMPGMDNSEVTLARPIGCQGVMRQGEMMGPLMSSTQAFSIVPDPISASLSWPDPSTLLSLCSDTLSFCPGSLLPNFCQTLSRRLILSSLSSTPGPGLGLILCTRLALERLAERREARPEAAPALWIAAFRNFSALERQPRLIKELELAGAKGPWPLAPGLSGPEVDLLNEREAPPENLAALRRYFETLGMTLPEEHYGRILFVAIFSFVAQCKMGELILNGPLFSATRAQRLSIVEAIFSLLKDEFLYTEGYRPTELGKELASVCSRLTQRYLQFLGRGCWVHREVLSRELIICFQYCASANPHVAEFAQNFFKNLAVFCPVIFFSRAFYLAADSVFSALYARVHSNFNVMEAKLNVGSFSQGVSLPSSKKEIKIRLESALRLYVSACYSAFYFAPELSAQGVNLLGNYPFQKEQIALKLTNFVHQQWKVSSDSASGRAETLGWVADPIVFESRVRQSVGKLPLFSKNVIEFVDRIKVESSPAGKLSENMLDIAFSEEQLIARVRVWRQMCLAYLLVKNRRYLSTQDFARLAGICRQAYPRLAEPSLSSIIKDIIENLRIIVMFSFKEQNLQTLCLYLVVSTLKDYRIKFAYREFFDRVIDAAIDGKLGNHSLVFSYCFELLMVQAALLNPRTVGQNSDSKSKVFIEKREFKANSILHRTVTELTFEKYDHALLGLTLTRKQGKVASENMISVFNFIVKILPLSFFEDHFVLMRIQLGKFLEMLDFRRIPKLSLMCFLKISEVTFLMLTFLEKIQLRQHGLTISNEVYNTGFLMEKYLKFAVHFFSSSDHSVYKSKNAFSLNNLNTREEIRCSLNSTIAYLSKFQEDHSATLSQQFVSVGFTNTAGFFEDVRLHNSRFGRYFTHKTWYFPMLQGYDPPSLLSLLRSVIIFTKSKLNLLLAIILPENPKLNSSHRFFEEARTEVPQLVKNLFFVNPLTANEMLRLMIKDETDQLYTVFYRNYCRPNASLLLPHSEMLEPYLFGACRLDESADQNPLLIHWKNRQYQHIMYMLSLNILPNVACMSFLFRSLMKMPKDDCMFFIFQLIQGLSKNYSRVLKKFFFNKASDYPLFSHQVIWQCNLEEQASEEDDQYFAMNVRKRLECSRVSRKILGNFSTFEKQVFEKLDFFLNSVTAISSKMLPSMDKQTKIDIIKSVLDTITIPEFAYLPTNPQYKVLNFIKDSARPMQSAAKCPFRLAFECEEHPNLDEEISHATRVVKRIEGIASDAFSSARQDTSSQIRKLEKNQLAFEEARTQIPQPRFHSSFYNKDRPEPSSSVKIPRSNLESRYKKISTNLHETMESREQSFKEVQELNNLKELISDIPSQVDTSIKPKRENISCIFKTKDDIRQDTLTLQYFSLLKERFDFNEADVYLRPYRTYSNRTATEVSGELKLGGIIEVIPDSISRDQIGRQGDTDLFEYFHNKFGPE